VSPDPSRAIVVMKRLIYYGKLLIVFAMCASLFAFSYLAFREVAFPNYAFFGIGFRNGLTWPIVGYAIAAVRDTVVSLLLAAFPLWLIYKIFVRREPGSPYEFERR
jgi:hypothetical protein